MRRASSPARSSCRCRSTSSAATRPTRPGSQANVRRLAEAGAAGLNLEDVVSGDAMRPLAEQLERHPCRARRRRRRRGAAVDQRARRLAAPGRVRSPQAVERANAYLDGGRRLGVRARARHRRGRRARGRRDRRAGRGDRVARLPAAGAARRPRCRARERRAGRAGADADATSPRPPRRSRRAATTRPSCRSDPAATAATKRLEQLRELRGSSALRTRRARIRRPSGGCGAPSAGTSRPAGVSSTIARRASDGSTARRTSPRSDGLGDEAAGARLVDADGAGDLGDGARSRLECVQHPEPRRAAEAAVVRARRDAGDRARAVRGPPRCRRRACWSRRIVIERPLDASRSGS